MRLFIAIEFPEDIQKALRSADTEIRCACAQGNFPREENAHLTLCFLGETAGERLADVKAAMESVSSSPLSLQVTHMGRFRSREGDTLYRAVEGGEALYSLQHALCQALIRRGFSLEERRYTPHLTVARRAVLRESAALRELSARLPTVEFTARYMTLLRSEQIDGRRVYTPVYRRSFEA